MAAARQESRQDGRQDSRQELRQDDNSNSRRRPAQSDLEDEREAKRTKLRSVLNPADCNLDFNVTGNGLTGNALHEKGFGYCWSGARANLGILSGRYCFGCKITGIQKVDMPDTANDQKNLCRIGISRGDSEVACLGESKHSFGYGGAGKFSTGGNFKDYGDKFYVGDTIVCYVDLDKPMATISFSKNGKFFGTAKEIDKGPAGVGVTEPVAGQGLPWSRALFPHVLLKNVTVQMQFSVSDGLVPMHGYKAWDTAVEDGLAMEGPRAGNKSECEVLMMVGLPASGKTTWAENWSRDHPDKRYVIIGTNLALDQMKVPGLQRKHNYAQRWEQLMSRATEIFNTLLDRAALTPRNYIIDQTNVYLSARKRKLRPFSVFRKVAVVVVPKSEEHSRRTVARAKELGKEVPVEAVNEMKANFVLPKSKDMAKSDEPFDEVWFVERQRQEAEQILVKDKASVPKIVHRQGQNNFGPGRGHGHPGGSFSADTWGNAGQFQRGHLPLPVSQGYGPSLLGSPDQLLGARGELLGHRVDAIGPRGELLGPRGEILGQRGEFFGQRGELNHQRGDFIGPRGEVYSPRGELIGLRGDVIGPRGEPLIPRGDLMGQRGDLIGQRGEVISQRELAGQRGDVIGQRELMGQRGDVIGPRGDMIIGPRGELIGQRGELIGQRGELIGQRGELIGQRGELIGQRGELIGQRGEIIGPRGEQLGQRGELIGQRGMHIQTANGLPLSAYDTVNSLSPTMNLPRSGFDSMNPTSGHPRSGYDPIHPVTGVPRPGFDAGNAGIGGQRSSYDGLNSMSGLPKSQYDSGNHAGVLPRSAYDIVGPGGGLGLGGYDGMGSAGGLSRTPYDAFNPNGYSHNISSGAGGDYGGGPHPHVQSPGHRGPLLPLPNHQPSRQHYY